MAHSLDSAAAAYSFDIELIKRGPCPGSDEKWCDMKDMIMQKICQSEADNEEYLISKFCFNGVNCGYKFESA